LGEDGEKCEQSGRRRGCGVKKEREESGVQDTSNKFF